MAVFGGLNDHLTAIQDQDWTKTGSATVMKAGLVLQPHLQIEGNLVRGSQLNAPAAIRRRAWNDWITEQFRLTAAVILESGAVRDASSLSFDELSVVAALR